MTTVLSLVLLIWLALLAVSIPHQRMHGDEAWLGEQAYLLAHDGIIRSDMFRGYAMQEQHILITHKLFIVFGAVATAFCGWGITPLRALSLLSGLIAFLLVAHELRRHDSESPQISWRIGILALLAMPLFFKFTNLYRPEVMLAAFGLASYVLLSRHLSTKKTVPLLASAIVAGLAVLVHINGVMYVIAGVIVLILHRRFRDAGIFAAIGIAISLLYFVDVLGQWDLLHFQLLHVPSLTTEDFRWDAPFCRLVNEHKRLFRKPEIIFSTVLFVTSFAYAWARQPHLRRSILAYCVTIVLVLGAVGQAKTTPYAIALFPFFAIVIARATTHWWSSHARVPRWVTVIAIVVWTAFLIHSAAADSLIAFTGKENVAQRNQQIAGLIPKGSRVLAPMEFVFNEIGQYDIRAMMAAELLTHGKSDEPLTRGQLLSVTDRWHIDAIILDRKHRDQLHLQDSSVGYELGDFRAVAVRDDGYVVLRRE